MYCIAVLAVNEKKDRIMQNILLITVLREVSFHWLNSIRTRKAFLNRYRKLCRL